MIFPLINPAAQADMYATRLEMESLLLGSISWRDLPVTNELVDLVEDQLGRFLEGCNVEARKFDEPCMPDVLRNVPRPGESSWRQSGTRHDQRRDMDLR